MIDFLIVGGGLAGIAFAETAVQSGATVHMISNSSATSSSAVAAGIYNPVILKRFSGLNQAQHQLDVMNDFYHILESKLGRKYKHKVPVLRLFASIEEQNNWFAASDKMTLSAFLSTTLYRNHFDHISSPYDYGEVHQTGYLDVKELLIDYREYLLSEGFYSEDNFDYDLLKVKRDSVEYKNVEARHTIFAEGFGLINNPWFGNLPLDGTKGELLVINAPALKVDKIINAGVFVLPVGRGVYKVGATYNWVDKDETPTKAGFEELMQRTKEVLECDFEVIEHLAGIRPTVKDRKPLLGTHHVHKNMHVFNGLGTRGVMLGPAMAKLLYNHIVKQEPLPREADIKRFKI